MKIRCGSHQQNRSIVRPGLSLMATKVALTAEEFRENSQRSIALFNTEKLSTDSTRVLKSAYCILCISAVAICTGRVEAKLPSLYSLAIFSSLQSARGVWRQSTTARVGASRTRCNLHGACGGKGAAPQISHAGLWRCNLHGACGGKAAETQPGGLILRLQSARGVWRQRACPDEMVRGRYVAICTGRVEAKLSLL